MKTYFQPGHEIDIVASAPIKSGDIVVAGTLVGIAAKDLATGEVGVMEITGVHKLKKLVADAAWTQGAPVYTGAGNTATTTAGGTFMGYAAYAAADADLYGYVLLARAGS